MSGHRRVLDGPQWVGLHLPDDLLLFVLTKLGTTLVFQDGVVCSLVCASQVNARLRRLVHGHVATCCSVRQPLLTPARVPSLALLPLHRLAAVATFDLSHCLDWVQHPCLRALADMRALSVMTQLRTLVLRPHTDDIDLPASGRIKARSHVLNWATSIMPRIWDRWMYAHAPTISCLASLRCLTALTNLRRLTFPIALRHDEDPSARIACVAHLTALELLHTGRAKCDDAAVAVITRLRGMTELALGHCTDVTGAGVAALAGLDRLARLALYGCCDMRIADAGWQHLSRLRRLRALALHGRREGENVHFLPTADPWPLSLPLSCAGVAAICSLTGLEELRLAGCARVGDRGLQPVTALAQLTSLEVYGCPHVAPGVLSAVAEHNGRLRRLHLRNVKVALPDLRHVARLSALRSLSLDEVGVHPGADGADARACLDASLAPLRVLTQLESLLLWRANGLCLRAGGMRALGRLSLLTRLTASRPIASFEDADLAHVAALRHLHTLELCPMSAVTDAGLRPLRRMVALRNLDLDSAPRVGDAGFAHLAQCSQLLSFRVCGSRITDASLAVLAAWPRLRNLSLCASHGIGDAGVARLSALANLKILDLADCPGLSDAGLLALVHLRELRQLCLETCRSVTNEGVRELKQRILAQGPPGYHDVASLVVFF